MPTKETETAARTEYPGYPNWREYGPRNRNNQEVPYWFLYLIAGAVVFILTKIAGNYIDRWMQRKDKDRRRSAGANTYTIDDSTVERIIAAFEAHSRNEQKVADTLEELQVQQMQNRTYLREQTDQMVKNFELLKQMHGKIVGNN